MQGAARERKAGDEESETRIYNSSSGQTRYGQIREKGDEQLFEIQLDVSEGAEGRETRLLRYADDEFALSQEQIRDFAS